jgi:hypothetical protein
MDRAGTRNYELLCCRGPGRPESLPGEPLPQSHAWTFDLEPATAPALNPLETDLDALGPTNWFQGMWPTDPSMPEPKFPHFKIDPVRVDDSGVRIQKATYNDPMRQSQSPVYEFALKQDGQAYPFYTGGPASRICYRTGNLLHLQDEAHGSTRSVELIVHTHQLLLMRIRMNSDASVEVGITARFQAAHAGVTGDDGAWRLHNERGWHVFLTSPGHVPGELLIGMAYDIPTALDAEEIVKYGRRKLAQFDACWRELADSHSLEPFTTGKESSLERDLLAACVNRALRNTRMGGLIRQPSMVEFYGPEWEHGDGVWIAFLPACRYLLWIAPEIWANTIRTLLDHQTPEGMVPQAVFPRITYDYSQIPNLTPCVREYFAHTGDRPFLSFAYPRLKAWYVWWMTHRNPSGDGIIAVGSSGQDLYSAICEYKDNGTDPDDPDAFEDTCMPFTRTASIAGRPERVYLPDIVACQARMADDLAFMAGELGQGDDQSYFTSEYHRLRDWANAHLWDEATQWYYPVERATGRKVMKRTNTVYWLMWAGLVPKERVAPLVDAMFDPEQFFTTIPVPLVSLNDPSFNLRCDHWGDACAWSLDAFIAFDGLLRYGEHDRAVAFAEHYNRNVFATIAETRQPAEFYHCDGHPCGCPIMGSAGLTMLNFQRYLREHS